STLFSVFVILATPAIRPPVGPSIKFVGQTRPVGITLHTVGIKRLSKLNIAMLWQYNLINSGSRRTTARTH
ncbi:MAG: hypothetical protein OXD38_06285, partial [Aestuariivita sp.]|nr:hypothetical protein [Aestuariivita sp.]